MKKIITAFNKFKKNNKLLPPTKRAVWNFVLVTAVCAVLLFAPSVFLLMMLWWVMIKFIKEISVFMGLEDPREISQNELDMPTQTALVYVLSSTNFKRWWRDFQKRCKNKNKKKK